MMNALHVCNAAFAAIFLIGGIEQYINGAPALDAVMPGDSGYLWIILVAFMLTVFNVRVALRGR